MSASPGLSTVQPTDAAFAAFRTPRSVAVVGASADPTKWGHWIAKGALTGMAQRKVWLVNRTGNDVLGHPTYADIADLPGVPELVVVCVPGSHVAGVVRDAAALGTKAFLTITAALSAPDSVREVLDSHGARMVGPNSLGLFDAEADLRLAWGEFTKGALAIVSQSGQLGSEIAGFADDAGLGVSRFVSVGNQWDVSARDVLDDLVTHTTTEAVAVYLESFDGGPEIVAALRKLRDAGKPVIVLSTGASESSRRLAASHTGSLTSSTDLIDAACRAAGAVRVDTPLELVDLAGILGSVGIPAGNRVAIVSDSGGQGGIAADVAGRADLDVPSLSADLRTELQRHLTTAAATSNPIDLAGAGEADLRTYAQMYRTLATSGEVDAVVLTGYFGCYGTDTPSLIPLELDVADELAALVERHRVPLIVHSMSADSPTVHRLREHGIPVHHDIARTLRSLGHANLLRIHPGRTASPLAPLRIGPSETYGRARDSLQEQGIRFTPARTVACGADVEAATEELTAPYVLKAGWIAHKTEVGGIALGLTDAAQATAALLDMQHRLGDGEYVLEEQDTDRNVVEILVGARRDRDLGPTITVGGGGTEAELWQDVRTELAPVGIATARDMLTTLRTWKLLTGWRGKPAVDVDSLAAVIARVSEILVADDTIAELEINPVRVGTGGSLAADALVVRRADIEDRR
ncbi:acetate--CoA ligase family protein [Gordonia sp. NPDC003376]